MPIMGPNGPMDPGAMDAGQMANMPVDGFAGATAETWRCHHQRWLA